MNSIDKFAPVDLLTSGEINYFVGPNLVGIIGGVDFVIVACVCWFRVRAEEKQTKPFEKIISTTD